MNFGRVHGRATPSAECGDDALLVEVTLEAGTQTRVVRAECAVLPPVAGAGRDLRWWADQFTQETIGTVLAEEGWEAIAMTQAEAGRATIDTALVTYVVRRM